MDVIIEPKKLSGSVLIPPSKSLSHRAIIAASLCEGRSVISNITYSEDIIATINAMECSGARFTKLEDSLVIDGSKINRLNEIIDVNESGSTLRFIIPILLTCPDPVKFVGHNNLVNRPLDIYTEIFDKQKLYYRKGVDSLPLYVEGALKPGDYEIRGNVSSQFITGLLFALPLLSGDSRIIVTTRLESADYVELTLDILRRFGITIKRDDNIFYIKGNQKYKSTYYLVEGDYSQASFWLAANVMGSEISLLNLNPKSVQGDKKILDDLKSFGAKCVWTDKTLKALPCNTKGTTIDFVNTLDLAPALAVVAAQSEGETNFLNAGRLRIKESDRIAVITEEFTKLGADVIEHPDGMTIVGKKVLKGNVCVNAHNDHRIAMALSIAALACDGPVKIIGADSVNKSYPEFFHDFQRLGGIVKYEK